MLGRILKSRKLFSSSNKYLNKKIITSGLPPGLNIRPEDLPWKLEGITEET